jgi:hypothetical protein
MKRRKLQILSRKRLSKRSSNNSNSRFRNNRLRKSRSAFSRRYLGWRGCANRYPSSEIGHIRHKVGHTLFNDVLLKRTHVEIGFVTGVHVTSVLDL